MLLPAGDDQLQWLRKTCRIRAPGELGAEGRWSLPKSTLSKVVAASLDRFGLVGLFQDQADDAHDCDQRCQNAVGLECVCQCLGANHAGAAGWVTTTMTGLLPGADCFGVRRTYRRLTPPVITSPPRVYAGELDGVEYTTEFALRIAAHWPRAAEFACLSCGVDRAQVWDHCHHHGMVRAPLCDPCNRWMWSGWDVPPRSVRVVDLGYYRRCTGHEVWAGPQGRCSP